MSGGSCTHSNKSNRPRSRKAQCFRKDDQKYQKVSVVYIADFSAFSIFTLMTWIEFLSS